MFVIYAIDKIMLKLNRHSFLKSKLSRLCVFSIPNTHIISQFHYLMKDNAYQFTNNNAYTLHIYKFEQTV